MRENNIGIFIPVYHRDDKVRACINSLLDMEKVEGLHTRVMIGINGASYILRDWLINDIRDKANERWSSYETCDFCGNIGKPEAINKLVKLATTDRRLDYVVSCDSDMVAKDPRWLAKLVEAFELFPEWKDLGCLSTEQSGERCHVLDKDPFTYRSLDGRYTYVTRAGNEGVAGGCLITPYHVWRTLGGYHAHRLYASDDGHFALSCAQHNLLMCVVNEVVLEHPRGDDPGYSSWKHRALSDTLKDEEKKGYYT